MPINSNIIVLKKSPTTFTVTWTTNVPAYSRIEYGLTNAYGAAGSPVTAAQSPLASNVAGAAVSAAITGLTCNRTYHYQVTANNGVGGSINGGDLTFLTLPCVITYSAPTATGTGPATASFTGGGASCTFATAAFVALPVAAPPGVVFPHGLFDFTTSGCSPGSALTFTITFPTALPPGMQYWKYGPTPGNNTLHWYILPASIAGNIVTFSISDGGLGDDDLTVNGVVVDQGGAGAADGTVAFNLDVDANTHYDALTDGLLTIRYMSGLTGTSLIGGALGTGATLADATSMLAHLNDIKPFLDVDGNGKVEASTDGLMLIRYLFGLRGDSLIAGAIGTGAKRNTAPAIEAYIQLLMP